MPSSDPPSPAELEWLRLLRDHRSYSRWAERVRKDWLRQKILAQPQVLGKVAENRPITARSK